MSDWKFTGWHKGDIFTFTRPNGEYMAFVERAKVEKLEKEVEELKDENHDLKHDMMCSNNDRNELYLKERAKRKKLEGDLITAKNVIKEFKSMAKDSKELDELGKGLDDGVRIPREFSDEEVENFHKKVEEYFPHINENQVAWIIESFLEQFTPETPKGLPKEIGEVIEDNFMGLISETPKDNIYTCNKCEYEQEYRGNNKVIDVFCLKCSSYQLFNIKVISKPSDTETKQDYRETEG